MTRYVLQVIASDKKVGEGQIARVPEVSIVRLEGEVAEALEDSPDTRLKILLLLETARDHVMRGTPLDMSAVKVVHGGAKLKAVH